MHHGTEEVFAATLEKTGLWLDELMGEAGLSHPHQAYSMLSAVLHVLRDRLTVEEAVNLGAQLPLLVRGVYYDGWRPAGRPLKYRHKDEFLRQIGELYPGLPESARESAARAVFKLLAGHVTSGEIRHVRDQLPAEVRELWETRL